MDDDYAADEEYQAARWRLQRQLDDEARRKRLAIWGVASWVVALIIFCGWTTPIADHDAYDPGLSVQNIMLALLVGGGFAYPILFGWVTTTDRDPSSWKLAATSALIPLILIGAGFYLQPRHRAWDEGRQAFDAYTGRFPRSALDEPFLLSESSSVTDVCASQRRTEDTYFCVQTVTDPEYRIRGDYDIVGSYRFRAQDQGPEQPDDFVTGQFDCAGEVDVCE